MNLKYYPKLLPEFINFLINPSIKSFIHLKSTERIANTAILFIFRAFLSIIFISVTKLVFGVGTISKNVGLEKYRDLYTPLTMFFIGALLLPFIEEIGFRLYLKFKPINLALSIVVLSYYSLTKVVYNTYNTDINNQFTARILISLSIGSIAYLIILQYIYRIKVFWSKYFRWIYYFSCFSFALIHTLNYKLTLNDFLLVFILTFPHLISGMVNGFIRIKYGFIYSFGSHFLNNSIVLILLLFLR